MSLLDEIKLPKGSPKEELEQLSKDKLRPLFDIELFEIRPEEYRDKGLDLAIELKYKGSNTNFRFLIQLKSTETKKPNSDGSYSWQIDTSNIQYLLNGGLPAYYICYVKQNDEFYYRQINDFINEISQKNNDWNSQDSHTLRTSQILNKEAVSLIYKDVRVKCESTRKITEKLHLIRSGDRSNKVSITSEYQITDESSIIDLIEKKGLILINGGGSKEIVLLSEKISNDITSPLFNLVVGLAQYYTSHLFDALTFFKKSKRRKDELPVNLQEHLEYFDAICKYSVGYMNQQEYFRMLDSLKDSKHLSCHIKINNAKDRYINSSGTDRFEVLKKELFEIINNNEVEIGVKFIARCEFLLYWGGENNLNYLKSIALIKDIESKTGPNQKLRTGSAKECLEKNQEWEKYNQKLHADIAESGDIFASNACRLNEMKVRFELLVFTSIIKLEDSISGMPPIEDIDNTNSLNTMLNNLEIIADSYKNLHNIENLLATLSIRFEVLDFMGKIEDSKEVAQQMRELIEFYDLKEQKLKLDNLLAGETTKSSLLGLVEGTLGKSKSDTKEYDSLVKEMMILDEKEAKEPQFDDSDTVKVGLFPIGYFSIPRNRLDEFYEILKIDSYKLTKHLDSFFDKGIIPELNILKEVKEEGLGNGFKDDKGIESWRRVRDIRVALFKKKFVRSE